MQTKICSKCGLEKDISGFHKIKLDQFKYRATCKECKRSPSAKQKELRLSLIPDGFKLCTKCNKEKLLSDFYKTKNKFSSECKTCMINRGKKYYEEHPDKKKETDRKYYQTHKEQSYTSRKKWRDEHKEEKKILHLKQNYGITLEQYNQMLEQQNGVCAICGKPEAIKNRRLAVDHNHKSNKVRGLLCNHCNTALGKFNDNIITLEKAIDYLKSRG